MLRSGIATYTSHRVPQSLTDYPVHHTPAKSLRSALTAMVHNIKLYNGRYHHDDFVDATIETPFATFETDSEGLTYRSGVDKKAISGDSLSIAVTQTGVSVDGKDLKLSRLNNVQDGVKIITESHSARRDGGSGDTSTSYYHSPGSPLDPEQQTRFDEGMQNLWDGLGRMGGGFGFGTGAWPGMNTGGWGAGRRGGMNRKTTKSRTFTSGSVTISVTLGCYMYVLR